MQMPHVTADKEILFTFTRSRLDGVLFDLDGVVTNTATVHARAWKAMFDDFLQQWTKHTGVSPPSFDIVNDYARYIDGLSRQEGVVHFLASRGIVLPQGQVSDPPDAHTITALANRKNALLLELIRRHGVDVYPTTVSLIRDLRRNGYRIAIVSSSANCRDILKSAGLLDLFDARVDGLNLVRQQLRGKPAPDTFLEAAHLLNVAPPRAAVVEDAVAGVQAGHAGGFGVVIGVDRLGQADALMQAGATVVVQDLAQVAARTI